MPQVETSLSDSIHIYPLSRLVGAPAAKWEKILAELEEKQKRLFSYYGASREACVRLSSSGNRERDAIMHDMIATANATPHAPWQDIVNDNIRAFVSFEKSFLPKIKSFDASLLRLPKGEGTNFNGINLHGSPHMIVKDRRGRTRYAYLHPSDWTDDCLKAYLELLTIVVEDQFGGTAGDLWWMDLRTGKTIPWKSSAKTRRECRDAIKHYMRFVFASS